MKPIYQQEIKYVQADFKTDLEHGLSNQEAAERHEFYGDNALPEKKPQSWISVFLSQFLNPLIYILLGAAALIFFFSDSPSDAFIISGVLLFNAIVGTVQEGRTRKILLQLKHLATQQTVVVRQGKKTIIDTKLLVPGDIIILQDGQRVPADARIIESSGLTVDEAMLTGESQSVQKNSETAPHTLPLADRKNMLYCGTYILSGVGRAVVVATAEHTELGKIQKSVEAIQTDVPLAQEMQKLSWWILVFITGMCLLLFGIGLLNGQPIKELIVMLTALFICVVPEGLPVVLTLVLVSGVYRMAKQQVLVKNMQAVEGLGHAQVIIIDKTGTLTRNEMAVSHLFADGNVVTVSGKGYYPEGSLFLHNESVPFERKGNLFELVKAASLLSSATVVSVTKRGTFQVKGDPTEAALGVLAEKLHVTREELLQEYHLLHEIPFGSAHKYHALFFKKDGVGILYVVGSPETILSQSKRVDEKTNEALNNFLQEGLRVLAVARKEFLLSHDAFTPAELKDLEFLGFCGLQDAVRSEAPETIRNARRAGLHIIMATGDHQRTALSIAKQVAIYQEGDEALDGAEIDRLSDQELQEILPKVTVFSRVSPEQKLRIVQMLHAQGQYVAMTGDGVNDAPALVAADIGIAMGGIGSEVAQQAADIILLDDSIINILKAIEEGRHTIYTLRRVILYFFSTNFAEILIVLFAFLLNLFFPSLRLAFPLLAAQILWLNLITDGFLDSALALEKKDTQLLADPQWLSSPLGIIDRSILWKVAFMATPMAIGSLWIFTLYDHIDLALAHTMTLVTLAAFQWFNACNCRSEYKSLFQLGLFTNGWLIAATVFVAVLQLLLLHVPLLQTWFKTVPLNGYQWAFALIIASSVVVLEELRKGVVRSQWYIEFFD